MNIEKAVYEPRSRIKDSINACLEKLANGRNIIVLGIVGLILAGCGVSRVETNHNSKTSGMSIAQYQTVEKRAHSDNEVTSALGKFEQRNGNDIFSGAMQFFSADTERIDEHAKVIKLSQSLDLKPLIILEPSEGMSYPEVARGNYNEQIKAYFEGLRSSGITSEELGDVVICPEPVVGGWPGATVDNYAACLTNFAVSIREVYPGAHLSVLLDTSPDELSVLLKQNYAMRPKTTKYG
jgi:hypothetical protein